MNKKKQKEESYKLAHKKPVKYSNWDLVDLYMESNKILAHPESIVSSSSEHQGKVSRIAQELMKEGYKIGNLGHAVRAFKLYELINREENQPMLKYLNKTLKKAKEPKYQTPKSLIDDAEHILALHPIKKRNLEKMFLFPIFGALLLAGILFSFNITGASIGALQNSKPLGIGLFLIGLIGMYVFFIKSN